MGHSPVYSKTQDPVSPALDPSTEFVDFSCFGSKRHFDRRMLSLSLSLFVCVFLVLGDAEGSEGNPLFVCFLFWGDAGGSEGNPSVALPGSMRVILLS